MRSLVPGVSMAMGGRRMAAALLSQLPAGLVWAVDGTSEGAVDGDGNTVITSLRDLVGSSHFSTSATESKRPRTIPVDYMLNGKRSILINNAVLGGANQSLWDPTTDNSLWYPIIEVEQGPGATLLLAFSMRETGTGQILGNYPGNQTTPGFYIIQSNSVLEVRVWKSGVNLIARSVTIGDVRTPQVLSIRIRTDRTYSIRLDGVEIASGTTLTTSVANPTLSNTVTIGTRTGSDTNNWWGGHVGFMGLYHSALSDVNVAAAESALTAYYDNDTPVFDSGPVAGASVLAAANVAVLGTSIDYGYNDEANSGYAGRIDRDIAPLWNDLTLGFVGGNPGALVDVMAVGSLTIRGLAAMGYNGLDTISPDHALRMDYQLATMNAAGAFNLPLIVVVPVGWVNDLRNGGGRAMSHDSHGDLVRMLVRLRDIVRGYSPGLDVRFVVQTCTPSPAGSSPPQIPAVNAAIMSVKTGLERRTGCPVALVDSYGIIHADEAGLLADTLHPNVAGHTAIAAAVANGIRYVCGRAAA